MTAFLLALVALVAGSANSQRALPLSSFKYPSAPLLPIAPIVEYRDTHARVASPRITNVRPFIRNEIHTTVSRAPAIPDPCNPSPCGPNTRCERKQGERKHVALCKCLDGFSPMPHTIQGCEKIQKPINRGECVSDRECPHPQLCIGGKCSSTRCPVNSCGFNADCQMVSGRPVCSCPPNFVGTPEVSCRPGQVHDAPPGFPLPPGSSGGFIDNSDPCDSNPCGINAQCYSEGNKAVCTCLTRHDGDPLTRCNRYDCDYHEDCPNTNDVCYQRECRDPCTIPEMCGQNAICKPQNRQPICSCPVDFVGDPLTRCTRFDYSTLCSPSPCGPNTNCQVKDKRAVCSCQRTYDLGNPLDTNRGCYRECNSDRDCYSSERVCHNYKCTDPCLASPCGEGASCKVRNGKAVCSCPEHYIGSPYTRCFPECTQHSDCPARQVCDLFKCANPCLKDCGENADCRVDGRNAVCSCPKGYTGDPYEYCRRFRPEELCQPNPCGHNADCTPGHDRQGNDRPVCTCPRGYFGDPLTRCTRGECQHDTECRSNQACYNFRCQSTCYFDGKSVCGRDAECNMRNHRPVCSCPSGYDGNPLTSCSPRDTPHLRYVAGRTRRNYRW